MASQTAADLRTLVTRRAGGNRRVALLSADGALAQALQDQGATVLVDPGSLDEVVAFNPQVVVAFDGFAATGGPAALEALVQVAAPSRRSWVWRGIRRCRCRWRPSSS